MKKYAFTLLFFVGSYLSPTLTLAQSTDSDGIMGGHEYVDLGLPSGTLWATCNLGASSPYENGPYFAWGEVEPRDYFSWATYEYYEGFHQDDGGWFILDNIGDDICGTEYDAASHLWGNGWRMPNETERYELRMRCWSKWVTENGINGVRVHGPNEHSIFLPACGYGEWVGEISLVGVQGGYWVGVSDPECNYLGIPVEPSSRARGLFVDSAGLSSGGSWKATGKNIRAVINPREAGIADAGADASSVISLGYNNGYLTIEGRNADYGIAIHDLSGRMVFSGVTVNNACRVPSVSNGIYIATLTEGGAAVKTVRIHVK